MHVSTPLTTFVFFLLPPFSRIPGQSAIEGILIGLDSQPGEFSWKKHAQAAPAPVSNSYATGFVAFVLQTAGVSHANPALRRALEWLKTRQDPESGSWAADSMNKKYEPDSMQARFMRDAATAFATLALLDAEFKN